MMSLLHIENKEVFQKEVLESDKAALVDFWAPWCGPCRALGPILEDVAKEYTGKVKFFKVNVDNNDILSNKYNIKSIPSLLIFKGGEVAATNLGAVSKTNLQSFINQNL